jgi:hypothetical protein
MPVLWRRRIDARWQVILANLGDRCSRCGQTFPRVVYDLHHPEGKAGRHETPTKIIRQATDTAFLEHLARWQIFCANCHRLHHAELGNWHPARVEADRGPCVICGLPLVSDAPRIKSHIGECRRTFKNRQTRDWKRRKRVELSADLRYVDSCSP